MEALTALWEQFKRHPLIWGGAVAGLLLLIWLASSGTSKPQTTTFSFGIGPSDAQVIAGTQLQITQTQAQQAATTAQLQASTEQTIAGDYYSYLTAANNNGLAATLNSNLTSKDIAQLQTTGAVTINGQNTQEATYAATLASKTQIQQSNNLLAATMASVQGSVNIANIQAQASAVHDFTALAAATEPYQQEHFGGANTDFTLPNGQVIKTGIATPPTINDYLAGGYTQAQAEYLTGVSGHG